METSVEYRLIRYVLSVSLWTLLGRAALWVLIVGAGGRPDDNPVYRVFTWMLCPVLGPLRWLLPRAIPDAGLGWIAFVLLWLALIGLGLLSLHLGWARLR